jgi:hypothetical protein
MHLLEKKIMKWTISGHSNTMIQTLCIKECMVWKRKRLHLLDFHNHSFMNLNVESRVAGKESRCVKVGM